MSYGSYCIVYFLSSLFPDHPKIVALFNEDIFKCAVSEIIIPPNNNSDVFPLVQKLREQLERSSTDLLSFFEACTRKIYKTRIEESICIWVELASKII